MFACFVLQRRRLLEQIAVFAGALQSCTHLQIGCAGSLSNNSCLCMGHVFGQPVLMERALCPDLVCRFGRVSSLGSEATASPRTGRIHRLGLSRMKSIANDGEKNWA